MRRIRYWTNRIAVVLAVVCAVFHVVMENYSAAAGWGVAALWALNHTLECGTSEFWRKMYFKASGLDEVEA